MFGAAAPPDLVGGGSREDLVGMELLGVGWCLHQSRSGGICAGGEFWSLVASPPPPSLFYPGVSLVLWWPSRRCGGPFPGGGADHRRSRTGRSSGYPTGGSGAWREAVLRFMVAVVLRQRHGPWRRRQPPWWLLRRASRVGVDSLFGLMWGGMLVAASVAEGAWAHGRGLNYE
jgi:hypothetical protein